MYVNTKYNTTTCTCIITYLPTPGKTLQHKRGWLGLLVDFLSLIKKKILLQLTKYIIIYRYYFEVHLLGKSYMYMYTKHSKWILNLNLLLKKNKPTQLKEKPLDSINIHYPCFIKISSVNAINLWHNRSCEEQIFFLNMKFKQHYLWH